MTETVTRTRRPRPKLVTLTDAAAERVREILDERGEGYLRVGVTNGGFDYGRRANSSNIQIVSGVDDLGDLTGGPTQIMNFGRFNGIRRGNADIDEQSIRLDFLYEMPDYDMSMGVGSLNIDVAFDFYRER